ncbi:MAG: 16S rRNA (guanine(966)-N(2))-methyltransferase RsmD [Anaerolineae bacterium]
MPIRVISGIAKGRKLRLVPGDGTRPIMDRVKEALFNILSERVVDTAFLDLYAGTGSVGIEALSRGAEWVRFVDNAKLAIQTIQSNVAHVGFAEQAEIVRADVRDYLRGIPNRCFELVYVAPPQYLNLWHETLLLLDANPDHICPDGWVIVQIDPAEKRAVDLSNLRQVDERRYGNTLLWFFERPGEFDDQEAHPTEFRRDTA